MELVYVSDLKSEFCGFESRRPHHAISGCSLVWFKAPALGAGDREFESHFPDHFQNDAVTSLVSQPLVLHCPCGQIGKGGSLKRSDYLPVRIRAGAPCRYNSVVECLVANENAVGSNPTTCSKYYGPDLR